MLTATGTLQNGSAAVINNQDQYEVFNNPHADDPTHSLLSKDHFGLVRFCTPDFSDAKARINHVLSYYYACTFTRF